MKKIFNVKSVFAVSLCLVMIIALAGYAFANTDPVQEDKTHSANKEEVVIHKQFDANNDKIFESLNERIKKADDTLSVPVIVMFNEKVSQNKRSEINTLIGSHKVKHEFQNINGIATNLTKTQIEKLSKLDIVSHIEYDEEVKICIDTADYWFGAQKARSDFNVDGNRSGGTAQYSKDDVVVAVIDTGIDENHVDLNNGKVIGWKDYVNGRANPYDDNGHGTHVAGIVAGEGDGNSNYEGVAKGAALVGLKVLNSRGSGSMSDVAASVDWCVTNKDVYGIDVINMSLGTSGSSDGTDATSQAVNNAVNNGITVVVAAGNSGSRKYTIGSPGAAAKAITVGSMGDVGELGFFLVSSSSRGPTADGRTKPDIAAPGYRITAPRSGTSSGYVTFSGTSMAAPYVAGTVALMLDANPNLSTTNIKNTLLNTAKEWGPNGKDVEYGEGRLDAYEAVKQAGGFSGTNIAIPNHFHRSETIGSNRGSDYWEFNVTNTSYPIAVTLVMPDWASSPDFDVYLYDSNGNTLDSSTSVSRQETINFQPSQTGTYRIRVYSYSGTGNYFFDLSAGTNSITLTQDQ